MSFDPKSLQRRVIRVPGFATVGTPASSIYLPKNVVPGSMAEKTAKVIEEVRRDGIEKAKKKKGNGIRKEALRIAENILRKESKEKDDLKHIDLSHPMYADF